MKTQFPRCSYNFIQNGYCSDGCTRGVGQGKGRGFYHYQLHLSTTNFLEGRGGGGGLNLDTLLDGFCSRNTAVAWYYCSKHALLKVQRLIFNEMCQQLCFCFVFTVHTN